MKVNMSQEVTFITGLSKKYDKSKWPFGLYFAIDEPVIYFRGIKYGITSKDYSDISKGVKSVKFYNNTITFLGSGGEVVSEITLPEATLESNGLLSADDKKKLVKAGLIEYGTTEYWGNRPKLIAGKNTIYVYSDTVQSVNGNVSQVVKIKIGDGKAYLVDLPFVSDTTSIINHINDMSIHVTQVDKDRWNKKLSEPIVTNGDTLVFTTN